jgi:hypothetical protein
LTFCIYINTFLFTFVFQQTTLQRDFTSGPFEYLHAHIFVMRAMSMSVQVTKALSRQRSVPCHHGNLERGCCSVLIKDPPVFVVGAMRPGFLNDHDSSSMQYGGEQSTYPV